MPEVYQITPDAGSAFFLRTVYLQKIQAEVLDQLCLLTGSLRLDSSPVDFSAVSQGAQSLFENAGSGILLKDATLADFAESDILFASRTFECEKTAMAYLARAEQNSFSLGQKLLKKGFEKNHIEAAFAFLKECNFLNDFRFASAWLRARSIDHAEGKSKKLSELLSRGISRNDAKSAIEEFYKNHSEEDECKKAFEKLKRQKRKEEKIISSLQSLGFSYGLIKNTLEAQDNF